MSKAPPGIGTYARQLSEKTHGTPAQFAKNHKDNGLSYTALLGCWQDKQGEGGTFRQFAGGPVDRMRRYADACIAEGVKVWLWGFPWLGHEAAYMDAMGDMLRALGPRTVTGVIHDPEVSYRDKSNTPPAGSAGQGEAAEGLKAEGTAAQALAGAKKLMELDRKLVTEFGLAPTGITSYGMAKWHALPWAAFADGGRTWGSPQLYTVTPKQVDQGLASWAKEGFAGLAPSIPSYGENSGAKLDGHLGNFVNGTEPTIDGFVVWSYPQIDGLEWATLKRWSEMLKTKSC